MSQTLFKVMAHSYCRYRQQHTLLQDCLNAISSQVGNVNQKLLQQTRQISEVLSLPTQKTDPQMSIIIQEQTQRSTNQQIGYHQQFSHIKQKFNIQIGKLSKIEHKIDNLIDIYKNQLLEMSKQMAKWNTKNQDMKKQLAKLNEDKRQLEQQNNELKDQITMQSAEMFISQSDQQVQSVFDQIDKNSNLQIKQKKIKHKSEQRKTNEFYNQKKTKNILQKQQQYKQAAKNEQKNNIKMQSNERPMGNILQAKIKQGENSKTQRIQVRIHSQKDSEQQIQKWRKLSKKIDDLKSKLTLYEDQIQQKDAIIAKLMNEIKELKQVGEVDTETKKKIKISNTTLRGEKTVLQNQLNSVKKLLGEKTQLCNAQDIQINQLKIQIQSFNQTLKWQSTTIDDLKSALTKSQNKTKQQTNKRVDELEKVNFELVSALNRQQKQLQNINAVTLRLEELFTSKMHQLMGRIEELQIILDEKNQHIVKLKTKNHYELPNYDTENINPNIQIQSQTYLNELIRVLTKKVAEKDRIIRNLQLNK